MTNEDCGLSHHICLSVCVKELISSLTNRFVNQDEEETDVPIPLGTHQRCTSRLSDQIRRDTFLVRFSGTVDIRLVPQRLFIVEDSPQMFENELLVVFRNEFAESQCEKKKKADDQTELERHRSEMFFVGDLSAEARRRRKVQSNVDLFSFVIVSTLD